MWRHSQVLLLLLLLLSSSLAQRDPLRRQSDCPNEARPHSRPYMAALLDSQNDHTCGGFLVGRQWVMTSARCESVDTVFLGAHDSEYEFHSVARVYQHPEFISENSTFPNDILLLKLRSKVRLNENIRILPLPTSSKDLSEGTPCSVAGWNSNGKDCALRLHEANASIYDRSECRKFYPEIDYGKICAGEREDSCQLFDQGEKGDPLVCNGVAHGILSYSNPCPPAVYTRISKYLPWIKETMAK
ncbi:mast cell protease 2-like [Lacerta agilis]|uniref:mast cell protease 2-like n=1 Tax=Lacerta agilis TaxID=80427 RepID=UPI001419860F|nr:mast cell protease 2-like [Lacerta agilis]